MCRRNNNNAINNSNSLAPCRQNGAICASAAPCRENDAIYLSPAPCRDNDGFAQFNFTHSSTEATNRPTNQFDQPASQPANLENLSD